MRIKGFVLAVAAMATSMASADLLLWQVNEADATDFSGYSYAQIKGAYDNNYDGAVVIGNKVGDYDGTDGTDGTADKIGSSVFNYASVGAFLGDDKTNFFFVELYGADNKLLAYSDGYSKADLGNYIVKNSELSAGWEDKKSWGSVPESMAFHSTGVPEPTSGILMLLGMGLLGLKRKRA